MNFRKALALLALAFGLSPIAGGCQSGGVGDPCVPEDEYQRKFAGFSATEVNVESRSFQCETRVCLVNHFRGRVSCPLGQTADTLRKTVGDLAPQAARDNIAKNLPAQTTDKDACRIPGSTDAVEVEVKAQCAQRPAAKSVYCSCRCGGDDPNAKYCECPEGFTCTEFPEFDLGATVAKGSAQLKGKYCVRSEDTVEVGGKTKVKYGAGTCEAPATDSCTTKGECGVKENP